MHKRSRSLVLYYFIMIMRSYHLWHIKYLRRVTNCIRSTKVKLGMCFNGIVTNARALYQHFRNGYINYYIICYMDTYNFRSKQCGLVSEQARRF